VVIPVEGEEVKMHLKMGVEVQGEAVLEVLNLRQAQEVTV
jgi:hypothetical protein